MAAATDEEVARAAAAFATAVQKKSDAERAAAQAQKKYFEAQQLDIQAQNALVEATAGVNIARQNLSNVLSRV